MKVPDVILCDQCKKRVAEDICVVCDGDLCNQCGSSVELSLNDRQRSYFKYNISYCRNCAKFMDKLYLGGFNTDIGERVKTQIKANLTVEALKDDKK